MKHVPPLLPLDMPLTARTRAAVFQSPSAPKPYPSAIRRWTARPGSWARPWRSSNVVVKAEKPPSRRKARLPDLPRRRHLASLGDRPLAHVVAEAGHLEPPRVRPAAGRAHPGADPVLDLLVLPVADHGLAALPQVVAE